MLNFTKFSSKLLQLLLLVSLVVFTNACSGNSSPVDPETEECPTDEARCEARQNNGI